MHCLIWTTGNQRYAADLLSVNSILLACETIPFPHSPPGVIGAINVRGDVIPVLSMRNLLGLEQNEIEVSNHFILTSWIPETHNDTVQLQFNLISIHHLYFI